MQALRSAAAFYALAAPPSTAGLAAKSERIDPKA